MNPTRERLLYQLRHLLHMITMAICSSGGYGGDGVEDRLTGEVGGSGGRGGRSSCKHTGPNEREREKNPYFGQWPDFGKGWREGVEGTCSSQAQGANTCAQERGRRRQGIRDKGNRGAEKCGFYLTAFFCHSALSCPRKYLHVCV